MWKRAIAVVYWKNMELERKKGGAPRFPFEQFFLCEKTYEQMEEKPFWKDLDALCGYAWAIDELMAHIVGTIDGETAKKWLDWERGEFFAVAFCGVLCFCIPSWTVVVSS